MLTRDIDAFLALAMACPVDAARATARAAFLVSPDGFARADESARDNAYMAASNAFDRDAARAEHRGLQQALSADVPVVCFAGGTGTPDDVFPNNVFATVPGRFVIGRMRHPVRQREALRGDIRGFFTDVLGLDAHDLSTQPHPCELTGALVIDRARGIGWCGLSERCDLQGAQRMHDAFGLRATLAFDLAPGEYHTNVVLAVLAGRLALASPAGFADAAVLDALERVYPGRVQRLVPAEHHAFIANAIALTPHRVWMSAGAALAMTSQTRQAIADAGFKVGSVPLAAVEAAGGSLRCCVGEIA